jgi:RimJ/RimL family protein N-acetyltransferase
LQKTGFELAGGYRVKTLVRDDWVITSDLCAKCTDYYALKGGGPPTFEDVNEIFDSLPEGKGYEDKFVLGIFTQDGALVGIVDLVRDYPAYGEWMIGLILIDPELRSHGLGTHVHEALCAWAVESGAKSFRIGVIRGNETGIRFWQNLGYRKIGEAAATYSGKNHIVDILRLRLTG